VRSQKRPKAGSEDRPFLIALSLKSRQCLREVGWQPFSNHFRQTYEQGYRYLDSCGEFMVRAVSELEFIPGDVQVTGAKLEKPEVGITAAVDTNGLVVTQEQPGSSADEFFRTCESLAGLAMELFRPPRIWSNGFAQKTYWTFGSPDAALKASLALAGNWQSELSKKFEMSASHKRLDCHFRSGSYEFRITIQPVTFERVAITRLNPPFRASPEQRQRIDRLNKRADRIKPVAAHALMMDLDLIEYEPPQSALRKHFDQLLQLAKTADKLFQIE
jgi:hypothetical protein